MFAATYPGVLSASSLTGNRVCSYSKQEIGTIEEIMLDVKIGRVAYAVIRIGGPRRWGERYFAVPWMALRMDPPHDEFVLAIPKEKLKNAQSFDRETWPDMSDARWEDELHTYYGYDPYWT